VAIGGGVTIGSAVLEAVHGALGLGLLPAGGDLLGELVGLGREDGDDAAERASSSPLPARDRWLLALPGGARRCSRWPVCWWWRWPAPGCSDP
jgi:hypothetical protein